MHSCTHLCVYVCTRVQTPVWNPLRGPFWEDRTPLALVWHVDLPRCQSSFMATDNQRLKGERPEGKRARRSRHRCPAACSDGWTLICLISRLVPFFSFLGNKSSTRVLFFIPNQRGQMFMRASLCTGGRLSYACLHVQDAWVGALHIWIGLAWTVKKMEKAREGLKHKDQQRAIVIAHWWTCKRRRERHQNAPSTLSRAHLSISAVKTSYLVPRSIWSSLWEGLKTPQEFWFQKERGAVHLTPAGRQWLASAVWAQPKNVGDVVAFRSASSLLNKPPETRETSFPQKSHSKMEFHEIQ